MYLAHYGLTEPPYSITPDPRFVFLSERHRDALAHLLFGVDQGGGGGFVQLTGEVGTGKTTLCRVLLEQLPEHVRVALVLNPQLSPVELLETICEELRLDLDGGPTGSPRGSRKALVDLLNAYLLEAYADGLRVVLIIDEAQNLSVDALEQVRLLTNLETPTQKLLQIVLLGQPELRTMLARDDLRQLAQRITARYHLTPLDAAETAAYLRHRWRVAGGQHFPFSAAALKRIHRHAGGVPRLVNVIAERALLAGYAHDETRLHERWVDRAAREALAPARPRWAHHRIAFGIAAALLLSLAAAVWLQPGPGPLAAASATGSGTPASPAAPALHSRETVAPAVPLLDGAALAQRLQHDEAAEFAGWRGLLALWQLPAGDVQAASAARCAAPLSAHVHCMRGLAGFDKLAALGRPALLRVPTATGDAWPLLVGLDAAKVRMQLGTTTFDVHRAALEPLWSGEYVALWQAPAALGAAPAAPLGPGARGPVVDWVAARLQPNYLAADAGPARFDTTMHEAVRRYQRARGLASDGLIGPETLMALSADGAGDGARLLRVLE